MAGLVGTATADGFLSAFPAQIFAAGNRRTLNMDIWVREVGPAITALTGVAPQWQVKRMEPGEGGKVLAPGDPTD